MTFQTRHNIEDFEAFIASPENNDRRFEYIGGEIVEMVSNQYASHIAAKLLTYLGMYLMQNPIGFLTGADGGYMVGDERYMPDVGLVLKSKQASVPHTSYNPLPPDLAIEVISPTDHTQHLTIKISNYLAAGTIVWAVFPDTQTIAIHMPARAVQVLGLADTLEGGMLLPKFTLPLKTIFSADADNPTQ